ncbi:MAG TPA: hypothetical protein VJN93_13290 [Candidatus Acidoferrum sp.]|nr:hypothetical protein [Candidatus Acidoferrum sp.]
MGDRTALIISCTVEQAAAIHQRAESERRTLSGYVLRIVSRWLDIEERLLISQQETGRPLSPYLRVRPAGKRTTMLIRCSKQEADRIRAGAKRRFTTISWFIVQTLNLSWSAKDRMLTEFRDKST